MAGEDSGSDDSKHEMDEDYVPPSESRRKRGRPRGSVRKSRAPKRTKSSDSLESYESKMADELITSARTSGSVSPFTAASVKSEEPLLLIIAKLCEREEFTDDPTRVLAVMGSLGMPKLSDNGLVFDLASRIQHGVDLDTLVLLLRADPEAATKFACAAAVSGAAGSSVDLFKAIYDAFVITKAQDKPFALAAIEAANNGVTGFMSFLLEKEHSDVVWMAVSGYIESKGATTAATAIVMASPRKVVRNTRAMLLLIETAKQDSDIEAATELLVLLSEKAPHDFAHTGTWNDISDCKAPSMLLVQRAICDHGRLSDCVGGSRDSNPVQHACYALNFEALALMTNVPGFDLCVTSTSLLHGYTCPQLLLFSDHSITYEKLRDFLPACSLTQLNNINCSLAMYAALYGNIGLVCALAQAGLVDYGTRDTHGRSLLCILATRPAADIDRFTAAARDLAETDRQTILTQLVARESPPSAVESVPDALLSGPSNCKATWGQSLRSMTKLLVALDSRKEHAGEFACFLLTKYGDDAKELLDLLLAGGNNKGIVTATMQIAARSGLRLAFGSLLTAAIDEKLAQSVLTARSGGVTPMDCLLTNRAFRLTDLQRAYKAVMAEVSPLIDEANRLVQSAQDCRSSAIRLRRMSADACSELEVDWFSRAVDTALRVISKFEGLAILAPFFRSACADVTGPNIAKLEFVLQLSKDDAKLAERLESVPRSVRGPIFFASPAISKMITEECPDIMLSFLIGRCYDVYEHGGRGPFRVDYRVMNYSITGDEEHEKKKQDNWLGLLRATDVPLGLFSMPSDVRIEHESGTGPGAKLGVLSNIMSKALSEPCFVPLTSGLVPFTDPSAEHEERERQRHVLRLTGVAIGRLLRHGKAVPHTISPVILGLLCGSSPKQGFMCDLYGAALCSGSDVATKPMPTSSMVEVMLGFMDVPPFLLESVVTAVGENLNKENFHGFMDVMAQVVLGPHVLGGSIELMREGFRAGLFGMEFRGAVATEVFGQLATASGYMTYSQIAKAFGAGAISVQELQESAVYNGLSETHETVLMFWDLARGMSYEDTKRLYE